MLYFTYLLDILFLIATPIVLGIFLVRKYDLEGRWWWIAAVIYGISQVIIIPLENYLVTPFLNNLGSSGTLPSLTVLILGALLLGSITGIFEELLRFGMFRWWANDARTFKSALLLGTGHGGAASIFLGILVLYNFFNMAIYRNVDLSTLVPQDQLQVVQAQIKAFWSVPWYNTLHEAMGQIFMLLIQISLAVIVLQFFLRGKWYWLFLAIGFHTLVETVRIIALNLSTELITNGLLGLFAMISIGCIYILMRSHSPNDVSLNALIKSDTPAITGKH